MLLVHGGPNFHTSSVVTADEQAHTSCFEVQYLLTVQSCFADPINTLFWGGSPIR